MWEIEPQITFYGNLDKMHNLHYVVFEDFQRKNAGLITWTGIFRGWGLEGWVGKNF